MKRKCTHPFFLISLLINLSMLIGITWVYGQDSGEPPQPSNSNDQIDGPNQVLAPLGTAFTYQGELEDAGGVANGIYDFSFQLLDGPDPATANQVGSPVAVNDVLITDGIFTVELDFGASPFTGDARWLEISVGRDGDTLTTLAPTQPLTAVPYALYGEDADADPTNEYNTSIGFTGTTLQITDGNGTLSQDIGKFNGNLIVTNGRLGIRELSPTTDLQITQSDGLINGTGGLTFSRVSKWKILHTGSHFSFVENNVRRAYIETGTGNYVITSDRAMKDDIEPLGTVLDGVLQLEPVQYHYRTQKNDAAMNYGFIAQDVAKIFPELARTAEDGTMGLAYDDFSVLAISAIQEQQTQIAALQRENETLRAEIDEIKSLLSQGNANGSIPANFQQTSLFTATPIQGNLTMGSLFSWSNLSLLGLIMLSATFIWHRQRKDYAK